MSSKTPADIMQILAGRVKTLRLHRHWSRQELADKANVNVYSLKRFERTGRIALERLLAICEVLDVLDDFNQLLKPRLRVDVGNWNVELRSRGRRNRVKESV